MVKDFNTSSLYNKTEPIFISTVNEVGEFEKVVIKYLPSNRKDVLKSCESVLKEMNPDFPFEYEFLEDLMAASYSKDQKMNLLIPCFVCHCNIHFQPWIIWSGHIRYPEQDERDQHKKNKWCDDIGYFLEI